MCAIFLKIRITSGFMEGIKTLCATDGTLAFAIATGIQTTKAKNLIFAKCTCLHLITQQNTRDTAYIVCWQQHWIWWAYSHASCRYIFSSLVAFNDSLKSRKRAVIFSVPPITCFTVFDSVLYGITARLAFECVRLLRLHMVYTVQCTQQKEVGSVIRIT